MKNKGLLVLSALLTLSFASCSPNQEATTAKQETTNQTATEAQEITIQDAIGRNVTIKPGTYKKVVCIGAGALRMYSYICDVNLLCGVEDIENSKAASHPKMFDGVARPYYIANKDKFETLPSCGVGGPQAQNAEAEKILSCDPDIVISQYEDIDKENALQQQLGVPVITVKYGSQGVFDSNVKNSFTILGTIFNVKDKADTLKNYIDSEKAEISRRTANVTNKPNVYICGLGNWGTTNHLMTSKNYEPFNVSNIKNAVVDTTSTGVFSLEKEKFVALGESIDVMIVDAAAVKNIKPTYKEDNTIFSSVKAWNDGKVYLQMAYNAYYTNLELALVNTWYNAQVVYPSLFEDINIKTKLDEVTTKFLGKALSNEIYAYPNSFGGYQTINTSTFFA